MDGIGEILGLQANAAALGIGNTAFSHGVGVVACVKLNAGAIGADAHTPSATGVGQKSAGIAEYLKIVIVAGL